MTDERDSGVEWIMTVGLVVMMFYAVSRLVTAVRWFI